MKTTALPKKALLILLLPAGILLTNLCATVPHLVESLYSRGIYQPVSIVLSKATGILPVSVAEILVISAAAILVWVLTKWARACIKDPGGLKKTARKLLLNILIVISILYFSFHLFWGFNYYRLPFADIAGLEIKPASVQELAALCESLIGQANMLRGYVQEDEKGVMRLGKGRGDVLISASRGYQAVAQSYPQLAGSYGRPKGVLLSKWMSYAGITGVYFPFTAEANVNVDIPDMLLPFTTAHEMAHQRGFAREDEANYIAYLATTRHPDLDFQYSGTLQALRYSMSALFRYDQERYFLLRDQYSDGLNRDLAHISLYWQQYQGPVEEISNKINDTYLKINRQEDGVHSYGRMVDLLLAEYRSK